MKTKRTRTKRKRTTPTNRRSCASRTKTRLTCTWQSTTQTSKGGMRTSTRGDEQKVQAKRTPYGAVWHSWRGNMDLGVGSTLPPDATHHVEWYVTGIIRSAFSTTFSVL